MSENEQKLDASTFDLGKWMQGKNTYPKYTVTVHVDREAGKQLSDIDNDIKNKTKRYDELVKESEAKAGSGSLAESPATASASEAEGLAKELKRLRTQRKKVLAKYSESQLTLTFRISSRDVVEKINASLREEHPEFSDKTDVQLQETLSESETYALSQMAFQLIHTVEEMADADGNKADLTRLDRETAASFLRSLSGDQQRNVMTNMNLALMGGREVDTQVDAGFPS